MPSQGSKYQDSMVHKATLRSCVATNNSSIPLVSSQETPDKQDLSRSSQVLVEKKPHKLGSHYGLALVCRDSITTISQAALGCLTRNSSHRKLRSSQYSRAWTLTSMITISPAISRGRSSIFNRRLPPTKPQQQESRFP